MSERWELLSTDPEEAQLFPDLATARTHVHGPAAPPNRFRQVHELRVGERLYYLKEFHHTQWKNRWRSRMTQPRCVLDGERERGVAAALASRGFAVARPVAWGQSGGASFYLCAGLEGDSLHDLVTAHHLPRSTAMAAAEFAGSILAAGVHLPDLSLDHVFVQPKGFAVIDLHNGRETRIRARRPMVRILRRFRRSAKGLKVTRPSALMFAIRFMRAASYDREQRRAVIGRVPPMDTHGRYEVPGRATAYRQRNHRRTSRELRLLQRVWPGKPGDLVLDSPSGAGRLAGLLTTKLGAQRIGADRAFKMLQESRLAIADQPTAAAHHLVQADAAALPFHDRSLDGVVVFRFLHHLEPEVAKTVVEEAARVADEFVVLSFFHPISMHGVTRRLREWLTGRARTRFSLFHRQVSGWLHAAGFQPTGHAADLAYLKDFWVTAYRRTPAGTKR